MRLEIQSLQVELMTAKAQLQLMEKTRFHSVRSEGGAGEGGEA